MHISPSGLMVRRSSPKAEIAGSSPVPDVPFFPLGDNYTVWATSINNTYSFDNPILFIE